jgi:hypothetical protein
MESCDRIRIRYARYGTTGGMEKLGNAQYIKKWLRCKGRIAPTPLIIKLIPTVRWYTMDYVITDVHYSKSQVPVSVKLVLLIVGDWKLWVWCSLHYHNVHTKFHENLFNRFWVQYAYCRNHGKWRHRRESWEMELSKVTVRPHELDHPLNWYLLFIWAKCFWVWTVQFVDIV